VAIDRAKEQQYSADVKRYSQLIKNKTISPNDRDYNQAVSNYQQAYALRLQDEEKLALMEKGKATIGDRTIANVITSPTDGYILQRNVNLGDPVVAQTSYQQGNLLFVIADMHTLIFKG
jgi:HlyD family secretion protein